ncbi:MAG TPA: hypothetical protein VL500_01060 [Candidatus Eisenbacteria bacterium]|nr:hypothetical protein [Candidatus Eisenbacteria bacterium]
MRRISVWEVLGALLVSAATAFAVSAAIGGINRHVADGEIEEATTERHLLRVIEGSEHATDGERNFALAIASLRTLLGQNPQTTVEGAFHSAEALGNASPEALNAIAPSERWAVLAPLGNGDARTRITSLDAKYHLAGVIRNGEDPSERIVIRSMPPMWTRAQAIGWYLAGCVLFALIYGVRAYLDRKHPIINAPWGSVPSLMAFAAAAPVTVPSVALYGVWRIFVSEIPWGERWSSFSQGVRVLGYRMHILRRLPSPVIEPSAAVMGPSRVVAPAAAQPEPVPAPQRAADEEGLAASEDEEEDDEDAEWFVIHPDELLGREHLLAEAGIPRFPIVIAVPEPLKAVAIEASRIGDFERVLDLADAEAEDEDTDIEKTVRRTYDGEIGEVVLNSVPAAHEALVQNVLETVSMNSCGANIAFTHMNGRLARSSMSEDGWVEIFHCCAPVGQQEWLKLASVYGVRPRSGMNALKPSGEHGLIVKDADGNAVVQIIGRKVFILCDLFDLDADKLPAVLARAVYDGIRVAEKNPLDDDDDAAAWRATLEAERDRYVELCLQNIDVRKSAIEKEIEGHETEIRECGQRITLALRKRHGAVQTLTRLVNDERSAEAERLKKEFDALAAAKPVLAVRAYADRVEVDTRTVIIPHMGRRYEIGRFRITIDDRGGLYLANLSNTASDTHCEHPHVRDRRPCLGNISEALAKLLGEREYALAVNLLFRFLESYNPSNPFSKIEHWKEVSR